MTATEPSAAEASPTLAHVKKRSEGVGPRGYAVMAVARPFGPYLAWLAIRLGLRPRHVTYFSLVAAVALVGFAGFGGPRGPAIATSLIVLWELLDVTDGTMARALGIRDNFGGFVDYAAGIALIAFLPVGVSLGAARYPDASIGPVLGWLGLSAADAPLFLMLCGAIMSSVATFMRVINRTLQVRFGDAMGDDDETGSARGVMGVARMALRNIETIGGLQAVILALAAWTGRLGAALAAYAAFYLLLSVAFAISVYRNFSNRTTYLR
jgi:phosphatidylglycerophosphate synthase